MAPLCPLMANGPMQSVGLMSAGGTLESEPPFTADPLNEARPYRVAPLSQLQGGHRYIQVTNAGFQCIQLEPWCGANVGFDLRTGRGVRQHGLRSGNPRISSARRRRRKGNKVDGRLSSGTRSLRKGSRSVKKCKNEVRSHAQRRGRVHFDVDS